MASYAQTLLDPVTPNPAGSPRAAAEAREFARYLLSQGQQKVNNPWQGVSNITNALMSGYTSHKADEAERTGQSAAMQQLLTALGVTPASSPAGSAGAVPPMAAPNKPMFGPTPNEAVADIPAITTTDSAGPMPRPPSVTPRANYSPEDLDHVVRTVYGEAANQGPQGMAAVAHVINNRLNAGTFGNTAKDVVLAKNQFEPWGNPAARARMMALSPDDPKYQQIAQMVQQMASGGGQDPTNGAVNFYAPKAQAALAQVDGRPVVPPWAKGPSMDIGDHRFFNFTQNRGPQLPMPNQPYQVAALNAGPTSDATVSEGPVPQPPMPSPNPMAGVNPMQGSLSAAPINPNAGPGLAPPVPASAAPASAGVAPTPSPAATPPNNAIPPVNRNALAAVLLNQWAPDGVKGAVMQQLLPKGPPTFGVIGEDEYGKKTYGWINSQNQTTTPANTSPAAAPSPIGAVTSSAAPVQPIPAPPPGVDPKKWREEQTKLRVAQDANKEGQVKTANIVVEDVDRVLNLVRKNPATTTGSIGQLLSYIGGTNAKNVSELTSSIKANAGFDKLQAMRASSPTGAALGNVSDTETKLLQSVIGSLEQSQGPQQLIDNLKRVKNTYMDIIHGPGKGPPREELNFQQDPNKPDAGPPAGVDAKLWGVMTPQERALWK